MDYHCHYTRQAPWMKKLCYWRCLHDTVTCDSQGCCASGTNGRTHRIRSSAARRSVCQPCDAGGTRHVWSSCDTGGSTEDHLRHCYCQPSPFLVALQWDEQRKGLSMAGKPIPPPHIDTKIGYHLNKNFWLVKRTQCETYWRIGEQFLKSSVFHLD